MSLPKWLGRINKRIFNPIEIRRGKRPVLTHVGRRSGNLYKTPLDAYSVENGYVFIVNYGVGCDWVQNILAAGKASLTIGDETYDLERPRLISNEEATRSLPPGTKRPPAFLRIDDYLRLDLVTSNS
jgi:deazaflavin-dependent oxidoreductase (nitroreductase family)